MAKKQFKIGECAVGGIIAVECTNGKVSVDALDYYTKKKVLSQLSLSVVNDDDIHNIDWIKSAIKL
jgi:hypothetical protein